MSVMGHSRPMHSVHGPINVRCYSNSDIVVRRSEVTLRANKRHLGTCNASTPRRPGRFKSVRSQNPCKVSEGQSPITPVGRLFDPPGACAVQPRSKVSIGNIAVNDFCFG